MKFNLGIDETLAGLKRGAERFGTAVSARVARKFGVRTNASNGFAPKEPEPYGAGMGGATTQQTGDRINAEPAKDKNGKHGYIGLYKGKQYEVYADSSYGAQKKLAAQLGARKESDVDVFLAEKDVDPGTGKGTQVTTHLDNSDGGRYALAEDLGRKAFKAGKGRVPAHDAQVMSLVPSEGEMGQQGTAELFGSWLKGWDDENLKAPLKNAAVDAFNKRMVCPNCDQWAGPNKSLGYYDCFNECARRGFADRVPLMGFDEKKNAAPKSVTYKGKTFKTDDPYELAGEMMEIDRAPEGDEGVADQYFQKAERLIKELGNEGAAASAAPSSGAVDSSALGFESKQKTTTGPKNPPETDEERKRRLKDRIEDPRKNADIGGKPVLKVYSGKDGKCMCGCSGTYWTSGPMMDRISKIVAAAPDDFGNGASAVVGDKIYAAYYENSKASRHNAEGDPRRLAGWGSGIVEAYQAGLADARAGKPKDLAHGNGYDASYSEGYEHGSAKQNAGEMLSKCPGCGHESPDAWDGKCEGCGLEAEHDLGGPLARVTGRENAGPEGYEQFCEAMMLDPKAPASMEAFKEFLETHPENSRENAIKRNISNGFDSKASLKAERDALKDHLDRLTAELHQIEGQDGAHSHDSEPRVKQLLARMADVEREMGAAHAEYIKAHERGNGSNDPCDECGRDVFTDRVYAHRDGEKIIQHLCTRCCDKAKDDGVFGGLANRKNIGGDNLRCEGCGKILSEAEVDEAVAAGSTECAKCRGFSAVVEKKTKFEQRSNALFQFVDGAGEREEVEARDEASAWAGLAEVMATTVEEMRAMGVRLENSGATFWPASDLARCRDCGDLGQEGKHVKNSTEHTCSHNDAKSQESCARCKEIDAELKKRDEGRKNGEQIGNGKCPCGYAFTDNDISDRCPECGRHRSRYDSKENTGHLTPEAWLAASLDERAVWLGEASQDVELARLLWADLSLDAQRALQDAKDMPASRNNASGLGHLDQRAWDGMNAGLRASWLEEAGQDLGLARGYWKDLSQDVRTAVAGAYDRRAAQLDNAAAGRPGEPCQLGCGGKLEQSPNGVACPACEPSQFEKKNASVECSRCHGRGGEPGGGDQQPCSACKGAGRLERLNAGMTKAEYETLFSRLEKAVARGDLTRSQQEAQLDAAFERMSKADRDSYENAVTDIKAEWDALSGPTRAQILRKYGTPDMTQWASGPWEETTPEIKSAFAKAFKVENRNSFKAGCGCGHQYDDHHPGEGGAFPCGLCKCETYHKVPGQELQLGRQNAPGNAYWDAMSPSKRRRWLELAQVQAAGYPHLNWSELPQAVAQKLGQAGADHRDDEIFQTENSRDNAGVVHFTFGSGTERQAACGGYVAFGDKHAKLSEVTCKACLEDLSGEKQNAIKNSLLRNGVAAGAAKYGKGK